MIIGSALWAAWPLRSVMARWGLARDDSHEGGFGAMVLLAVCLWPGGQIGPFCWAEKCSCVQAARVRTALSELADAPTARAKGEVLESLIVVIWR
jgi:hypothetical protein